MFSQSAKKRLNAARVATRLMFAIGFAGATSPFVFAQNVAIEPSDGAMADQFLQRYETFGVEAQEINETYRIQVALPMAYDLATEARFRVVYITDANLSFGTVSEIAFLAETDFLNPTTEPTILVGVGYEDPATWPHKRTRDFSPEDSIDQAFLDFTELMLGMDAETGGAEAFLRFLESELHPVIEERYRVAGETATLMTNSQGGVFGFYAFLQNSTLFDRYWIGSPAIFGRGTYLIGKLADRLEEGFDRPTHVYMSLGQLERTLSVAGAMPMEMHQLSADSYTLIDQQLAAVVDENFHYQSVEFEGETHNSVVIPAMSRAYRYLMRTENQGGEGVQ